MSDYEYTQHTPIDSYACERCGRRDGLDTVLRDDTWLQIAGRVEAVLCLWCIDRIAAEKGIRCSVTLFFAGRALCATSRSDTDQEHITKWAEDLAKAEGRIMLLRSALKDVKKLNMWSDAKLDEWLVRAYGGDE